jgi:hypothetical protein
MPSSAEVYLERIWRILGGGGKVIPSTTESVVDMLNDLWDANYSQGRCYPTLAAGKPIVSGVSWNLSAAFASIVPINAIPVAYHVSAVVIENCTVDGVYELALYHGAARTLMCTYRFAQSGGFFGNMAYQLPSVKLAANEQIDAKLAISGAAPGTITISLVYRIL